MNITNHEKKQLVPKETNDATVVSNKFEDSDHAPLLNLAKLSKMPCLCVERLYHAHT